mmetsp:Transcript_24248/g.43233  ORF Transcript_24248/g.43233 Transcript_24248/m.43233 type:complete len:203 (+) Transcript_24248:136-744(+)
MLLLCCVAASCCVKYDAAGIVFPLPGDANTRAPFHPKPFRGLSRSALHHVPRIKSPPVSKQPELLLLRNLFPLGLLQELVLRKLEEIKEVIIAQVELSPRRVDLALNGAGGELFHRVKLCPGLVQVKARDRATVPTQLCGRIRLQFAAARTRWATAQASCTSLHERAHLLRRRGHDAHFLPRRYVTASCGLRVRGDRSVVEA